jgi:hypothetical protein
VPAAGDGCRKRNACSTARSGERSTSPLSYDRVALIFLPLAALARGNGHMSVELLTQVFCDEWSRRFVLMGDTVALRTNMARRMARRDWRILKPLLGEFIEISWTMFRLAFMEREYFQDLRVYPIS